MHTGAGQNGYDVNSTMVSGDKDISKSIDPQFSLSEAHRLAAEILESKKNLTTIYVTHPHPDHLFGLAAAPKQAFPSARIVALLQPPVNGAKRRAGPLTAEVLASRPMGTIFPGPSRFCPRSFRLPC